MKTLLNIIYYQIIKYYQILSISIELCTIFSIIIENYR